MEASGFPAVMLNLSGRRCFFGRGNDMNKANSFWGTLWRYTVWAFPWLITILGVGLIVFARAHLSSESDTFWPSLLQDVGMAFLAGGIFAVVLKSLQFLGIYQKAISDVMTADQFLRIRNDLPDVWKRATSIITGARFSELSEQIYTDLLKTYLPSEEDYYYEDYTRTCKVDWKENSQHILSMEEDAQWAVIPTSKNDKITLEFSFSPSDGSPSIPKAQLALVVEWLKIDGEDYVLSNQPVDENKVRINRDRDGHFHCEVDLKGKEKYTIHRRIHREFYPYYDPYQRCFSMRFIKGARIIVQCLPDDLRVRFLALGTPHEFKRRINEGFEAEERRGDINREYDKLLFPNQGYALVFQEISEDRIRKIGSENIVEGNVEEKGLEESEVDVTRADANNPVAQ